MKFREFVTSARDRLLPAPPAPQVDPVLSGTGSWDVTANLAPNVMVAAGWFHWDGPLPTQCEIDVDGEPRRAELQWFSYPRCDIRGAAVLPGRLLIVEAPGLGHATVGALMLEGHGEVRRLGQGDLLTLCVDLEQFCRVAFQTVPEGPRADAMDVLLGALDRVKGTAATQRIIHEALRPGRDEALTTATGIEVKVEAVFGVSDTDFFITGWLWDPGERLARAELVSPEGERVRLDRGLYRARRADVLEHFGKGSDTSTDAGFLGRVVVKRPSPGNSGWTAECLDKRGAWFSVEVPEVRRGAVEVRAAILALLGSQRQPGDPLVADHVHPCIEQLQDRLTAGPAIARDVTYGELATNPDVSIIVPLHGRIDFVLHQLAQFVHDPGLACAELIYVLDSPELSQPLAHFCSWLFELYGVPHRLVVLSRNVGYAMANQAGVSVARGRLLLFLNSDVLPCRPGWLNAMVEAYDETENIGALGPKLLYEDGSVQHAGMYARRPPGARLYYNDHFSKGLAGNHPSVNVSRPVPMVTGAVMLVDRELYVSVGGFSRFYVQGDFEDSDLCLRFMKAGRVNWYLGDVELYHLEGQSYQHTTRRQNNDLYNSWLQTHLWERELTELEGFDGAAAESARERRQARGAT